MQFTNYVSHLEDIGFIESILSSQPLDTLFAQISAILVNFQDSEPIHNTFVFIRDVCLIAPHHLPSAKQFHDNIRDSIVRDALEKCLQASDSAIRSEAAYTLGKIGSTQSLSALWTGLWHAAEHDPLALDSLIFEIGWLEGIAQQTSQLSVFFQQIPQYHNSITRWAIASILRDRQYSNIVLQ